MKTVFCQILHCLKAPVWLKSPLFSLLSTLDELRRGGGGSDCQAPAQSGVWIAFSPTRGLDVWLFDYIKHPYNEYLHMWCQF